MRAFPRLVVLFAAVLITVFAAEPDPAASASASVPAVPALEVGTPTVAVSRSGPGAMTASAVAPTESFQSLMLSTTMARVIISTNRGAIERFELLYQHPISLPTHLRQFAVSENATGPLPVLTNAWNSGVTGLSAALLDQRASDHGLLAEDWKERSYIGIPAGDRSAWTVVAQSERRVVLSHSAGGMAWELEHNLDSARPTLHTRLRVFNRSASTAQVAPLLRAINGIHQDYGPNELAYVTTFYHLGGQEGSMTNVGAPPVDGVVQGWNSNQPMTPDYVGVRSRFYAAWWQPEGEYVPVPVQVQGDGAAAAPLGATASGELFDVTSRGFQTVGRHEHQAMVRVQWRTPRELKPGASTDFSWSLTASGFSAPERELLSTAERRIEFADWFYKFFKVLARGMTACLNAIHWVVQDYGVAVVVLTLLIKALLFRLTWKQYSSTFAMQKLAPELKRLQDQYSGNRQQFALKQMELFKKNGVNPLSGCLPLLIQIPIFMALYQAFSHSAELRGESFLWIHDLTLPDQVMGMVLNSPWPLLGSVLSLNPLPIIYVIVSMWMAFQQTPPAGSDETQVMMAKMMRWMPLLFAVIFYNMPSGLVLYFTVQAVISTIEIKYIKHKLGMK